MALAVPLPFWSMMSLFFCCHRFQFDVFVVVD
jgi:hypothetical protein